MIVTPVTIKGQVKKEVNFPGNRPSHRLGSNRLRISGKREARKKQQFHIVERNEKKRMKERKEKWKKKEWTKA